MASFETPKIIIKCIRTVVVFSEWNGLSEVKLFQGSFLPCGCWGFSMNQQKCHINDNWPITDKETVTLTTPVAC